MKLNATAESCRNVADVSKYSSGSLVKAGLPLCKEVHLSYRRGGAQLAVVSSTSSVAQPTNGTASKKGIGKVAVCLEKLLLPNDRRREQYERPIWIACAVQICVAKEGQVNGV
jgi:hypothetical protein